MSEDLRHLMQHAPKTYTTEQVVVAIQTEREACAKLLDLRARDARARAKTSPAADIWNDRALELEKSAAEIRARGEKCLHRDDEPDDSPICDACIVNRDGPCFRRGKYSLAYEGRGAK